MRTPTFIVRPHPSGRHTLILQPQLPAQAWPTELRAVAARARERLEETGGRVVFYDSRGTHIITERVEAPGTIQGSAYGMR